MPRQMLTDEYWAKLRRVMLELGIYAKPQLRQTIEGILYRLRVGCPWRDLPEVFGNCWNAVYKRFNDWSRKEKWVAIFNALAIEPDLEWEFIDGSIVKAHQHSSPWGRDRHRKVSGRKHHQNPYGRRCLWATYPLPGNGW